MKYFNLNVKHSHYQGEVLDSEGPSGSAAHWLNKNKAVVFFGTDTVEKIQETKTPREAFDFIQRGATSTERNSSLIVTIQNGWVWIYKPTGRAKNEAVISFEVEENGKKKKKTDIPKSFPINILKGFPRKVSEVPLILASMRANQAFSRNTFREINRDKYIGNIAAIQSVTQWDRSFKVDPLACLSSIELETLVAKLFESHGCFVPAYKGGFLADVDLFVVPKRRVKLENLVIEPKKRGEQKWSIQVKLTLGHMDKHISEWLASDKKHLLISLDENTFDTHHPNQHLNREWLRDAVMSTRQTREWLSESLAWLPVKYQKPPLHS